MLTRRQSFNLPEEKMFKSYMVRRPHKSLVRVNIIDTSQVRQVDKGGSGTRDTVQMTRRTHLITLKNMGLTDQGADRPLSG